MIHNGNDDDDNNNDNNNNNNNNTCNSRIQRRKSRFFFLQIPHRAANRLQHRTLKWPGRNRVQITCNTLSAYHVQHFVLRATLYEGTAQLLSLAEFESHFFEFYFIG